MIPIFIPVFKNYPYVKQVFETARSSTDKVEFFLLSNGSDFETEKFCKIYNRRKGFNAEVLRKPLGFAGSLNRILIKAIDKGFDEIIITHSDVLFHESTVDALLNYMKKNPDCIMAVPASVGHIPAVVKAFPELEKENIDKFYFTSEGVSVYREIIDALSADPEKHVLAKNISDVPAFILRPSAFVKKFGFFDEEFNPAFWEMEDMAARFFKQGVDIPVLLNAPVLHLSGRSSVEAGLSRDCQIDNAYRFSTKHGVRLNASQFKFNPEGKLSWIEPHSFSEIKEKINSNEEVNIFDFVILDEGNLDLLEVRLNVLNELVDCFVIVESSTDWRTGEPKPLYLKENKERFDKFSHKIRRIVVPNLKEATPEGRKKALYKSLQSGLSLVEDRDIVILSFENQIPDPRTIKEFIDYPHVKTLHQLCLPYLNVTDGIYLEGSKFCKLSTLKIEFSLDFESLSRFNGTPVPQGGWIFGVDNKKETKEVKNDVRTLSGLLSIEVPKSLLLDELPTETNTEVKPKNTSVSGRTDADSSIEL